LDGATQTLPMLYGFPSGEFHDIASGNNGFAAGTGYDLVTGLGTPNADLIVPSLVGNAAGQLEFGQALPSSITAGDSFGSALTVAVEDPSGNILVNNNSNVTISILSGPAGATLAGTITVPAVNGVATFSDLSLNLSGSYTLRATDGPISSGSSSSINVTAAAAAMLAFTKLPAKVNAAPVVSLPISVVVEDQFGNLVTSDNSTVTLAINTGPGTLGGTPTVSTAKGIATFSDLSLITAGTYTLLATDGSLIRAISGNITINPAAITHFMLSAPAGATSGTAFNFVVTALDAFNNTATGYSGAVFFTSSDKWAVLPAASTLTSGVGTFSATLKTAGNQTIDATDMLTSTLVGTDTVLVTSPGPSVVSAITPSNPVTGTTTRLSIMGGDPAGESNLTYSWSTIGTPPATVTFSANGTNAAKNSTATFTAAGVYDFVVIITDSSNLTTTSNVRVTVNQIVTSISVTPSSMPLSVLTTRQFNATAFDQFGTALANQPTFAWSLAGESFGSINQTGLYTAPAVSTSATIQAAVDSIVGTAIVTVASPGPSLTTAAKTASSSVTGTTAALNSLGSDPAGESNLIYTWSTLGTPPAPVTFSANGTNAAKNSTAKFAAAGTYTFQVTIQDSSHLNMTSNVTVIVKQTFTTISISPANPALNTHATQQFGATAKDQFGAPMATPLIFKWSLVSGVGSINTTGFYSAGGTAGKATIRATSGSISSTSAITVAVLTVKANLSSNFNRIGFTADGAKISGTGIDGAGNTYSANLLQASSLSSKYKLGTSNLNNVIAAAGQTIALPQGKFTTLNLLAAGVNGQKPSKNFTVHYTDGTSKTYTISLSNWLTPSNYSGESTALSMTYRNKITGSRNTSKTYLYQYTLTLNNTKTISSITLPSNTNSVIVAAINLNS
jgi:hypothetical protein